MSRFSLFAIPLALVGAIGVTIVGRSWAIDPPPVAKPADDNPVGGPQDNAPAKAPAARPARASTPASQTPEEPMPAGLRPYPPPAAVPQPSANAAGMGGGGQTGPLGIVYAQARKLRILTPEMAATREPQTIIGTDDSPTAMKINAALQSPAEIACKEAPLRDVVEQLKKQHKIEIQLDGPALKEAGVDESTPVTKNLKGISLRSALNLLLDELQLKFVIHNEVLLITSPAKAESDEYESVRIYPVKDLILVRNENGEIGADFQPLIELIANTVSTKTWNENGGTGQISEYQFQDRCLLVVCQTQEVHEEIAALLAALRRCAATDVKSGEELRLPGRPRTIAPTPSVVPGTGRPGGGGMF